MKDSRGESVSSQWTGPLAEQARMQMTDVDNYSSFLLFPLGTELLLVTGTPVGVSVIHITVNEEFYEQTRTYMEDGEEPPFQMVVYLLPEGMTLPDEFFEQEKGD